MKFDNTLLTNFLDEYCIRYEVEKDNCISFEYDGRYLIGYIYDPDLDGEHKDGFVSGIVLMMPGIREVAPNEGKKYLKLINQLNNTIPIVKFVLDNNSSLIHILVATPLDSSPEMDDLIPGLIRVLVNAHNVFMETDK